MGCLELFSGVGRLSKALRELGLVTGPCVDILNGAEFDLTRRKTQLTILRWVREGRFWFVHLGTPCTVWSVARKGITNHRKARAKELLGVDMAIFSSEVIRECRRCRVAWSLENPATSRLFKFDPIACAFDSADTTSVQFDMCMHGATHKKPTRLWTSVPELARLARACCGGHKHEVLQGTERVWTASGYKWQSRTRAAGAYPPLLCSRWAQVLGALAPPLAHGASESFEQDLRYELKMLVPRRRAERPPHAASGPARMDVAEGTKRRAEAYLQQHKVFFGGGRTSRDALSAHQR